MSGSGRKGESGEQREVMEKESVGSGVGVRELKPRVKHNFIDKSTDKYNGNRLVQKLVLEFEDRGKESSTMESGGIYCFGKVNEEPVVCSPLKRRRLHDGQAKPSSPAPWT